MASVLDDILTAIKTAIEGAGLSGISSSDIDIVKTAYRTPTTSTGIQIYPGQVSVAAASNRRDDVTYTAWVVPFQASNKDETTNQDRMQLWRQTIVRLFSNQRINVSSVVICRVEPGEIFPYAAFAANYDTTPIAIKVTSREPRAT